MENLVNLFTRDLERFSEEVQKTPDSLLWEKQAGVTNTCGVLVQHVAGNLRYFIGTVLAETGYERDREKEFTNTGLSSRELAEQLNRAKVMIEEELPKLDESQLSRDYPVDMPWDYSVHEFLLHLYGHLNYHKGQFNYLRRILGQK